MLETEIKNLADLVQAAAQQSFFHTLRLFFQLMHSLDRFALFVYHIFALLLDDAGGFAAGGSIIEEEIVFEFKKIALFDAQRVDDHAVVFIKFHEVHTAECGRILVLFATGEIEVAAFDFVGIMSDIVFTQGQLEHFGKCTNDGHNKSRRSTKTGTRRCIDKG